MRRLDLPIIFVGCFLILFGTRNILLINLFFVFIMLIEPKTTPTTRKGRRLYAAIAALFSFIFFKLVPQFDASLLALASANTLAPFLNRLKG
jgi:Na+-translocating ferredoxin:NAD+ oxidoreductase RnfD subunit